MAGRQPLVVDLFCGIGGLTHGFVLEKFTVAAGYDADATCKYAYEKNNNAPFHEKKIEELTSEEIEALYPDDSTRILVGCAPCQTYSSYASSTKVNGKAESPSQKDARWKLLKNFAELAVEVQPDVVSMENVTRLKSFNDGKVFKYFIDKLEQNGYTVSWQSVYCPRYGVPQTRRRLVLFASLHGRVELVNATHDANNYPTVKDAIGYFNPIKHGEIGNDDPLHRSSSLSDLNLKRIRASKPGGTWEDWNDDLVAECHKRETGKSYRNVYGRMKWDDPSPTITTQFFNFGRGRFGHPEQDRAISIREAALLQTFPSNYQFVEPEGEYYFERLGRHIGNAVPVELGRAIARSIKLHLAERGVLDE